ncbi:MAG: hypothetical protein NTY01_22535 [Verrucomicrobia bacterium]|nr:hypothetical protein [Verrucomicrobiota bacterium]
MPAINSSITDPTSEVLRRERGPLDAFFAPKNVAVIGATESQGTVGRTILWNLLGFLRP